MNRLLAILGVASVVVSFSASGLAQHGAGGPGGKMPSAAELDPEVKKLEAAAAKLEKQLKGKPKDAKLKLAAAEAFFKAGYAAEYSKKSLPPATRYRTALRHYRKTLAYNPSHVKAKKEKAQIEMIYKQMGRPVPG